MAQVTKTLVDGNNFDEVLSLYESVDWAAYTINPDKLLRALQNSHRIWLASEGAQIVGLLRTISDGESIVYLQDILVNPSFQRQGIGTSLMAAFLEECAEVRQKLLLTDSQESRKLFYEAMGFQRVEGNLNAYYLFD